MTVLFILISSFLLLGTTLFWLAGYVSGRSRSSASSSEWIRLQEENRRIQKQAQDDAKDRNLEVPAIPEDASLNEEMAQLTSALARAEGETDRAKLEIDNLRDEIEALKKAVAERPSRMPTLPAPAAAGPVSESDAIDALQAQLDMERVAHQKTRDELAQVKKLAAVKMATTPTFSTVSDNRGGNRFQTMAFSAPKGAGAANAEVLKGALDKVQSEKDKLQAELDRARKEIQILKMRNSE